VLLESATVTPVFAVNDQRKGLFLCRTSLCARMRWSFNQCSGNQAYYEHVTPGADRGH